MSGGIQGSGFIVPVPTMIFIDAGYFRKWLTDECDFSVEDIHLGNFSSRLVSEW